MGHPALLLQHRILMIWTLPPAGDFPSSGQWRKSATRPHVSRDLRPLGKAKMQAEFGSPPQHIRTGLRPLLSREKGQLAFIEIVAEMAAKIRWARCGPEDFLREGSIEPHQPPSVPPLEEWIAAQQRHDLQIDLLCRKIAAG